MSCSQGTAFSQAVRGSSNQSEGRKKRSALRRINMTCNIRRNTADARST